MNLATVLTGSLLSLLSLQPAIAGWPTAPYEAKQFEPIYGEITNNTTSDQRLPMPYTDVPAGAAFALCNVGDVNDGSASVRLQQKEGDGNDPEGLHGETIFPGSCYFVNACTKVIKVDLRPSKRLRYLLLRIEDASYACLHPF